MSGRYRSWRVVARPFAALGFAGALVLQAAGPVAAAGGELDDTFDGNGKLTLNTSAGEDFFADVAVQAGDQKIVAVGATSPSDTDWLIARFNTDGSLDGSFGDDDDGMVAIHFSGSNDWANAVAIQGDGKIVVVGPVGSSGGKWGIARLNTDGTLDGGFSGDGKTTLDFTTGSDVATDVAIQADQKVVVTGWTAAGNSSFTVARFTTAGVPDTSFSGDGIATANLTSGQDLSVAVAIDTTGKIVVAGLAAGSGGQIGLAKFKSGGGLDTTFSGDGRMLQNIGSGLDIALSVATQPADNAIVVSGETGGTTNQKMLAMRFQTNGALDGTFSGDGKVTIDITDFEDSANSIALQGDGKIVLGGTANFEFYTVARLTSAGALDTSFGDDGIMFSNLTASFDVLNSVAIQADGAIVAVGESSGSGGKASAARFLGS
jgi:uncharacterized delta-60 repeat protein